MNNYYLIKNEKEYQELIKTPRSEFKGDRIRMMISKRNNKMRELLSKKCYFNGDKKIEGKEYLEFHYFLRKYTYLYLTEKEDGQIAKKIFEEKGNWRHYNSKKDKNKADFIFTSRFYSSDNKVFKIKSLFKNRVRYRYDLFYNMNRKNLLYKELEKIPSAKKYLVFNYHVKPSNIDYKKIEKLFQKYKVMIFKPVGGIQGKNIQIFDNFDKFRKYCQGNKTLYKYKDWVLQEYIINPLLLNGKKFHIRGYYLVHQNKKYLMNEGRIILSEEKYKQGDYENKKIHDTHTLGSEKYVKHYPKDLKNSKKIQNQLENLFHLVGRIDKYFECWNESKDCYQLFGFDVMITEDYQVKILEVNFNPGAPNLHIPFGKKLFENQIKLMVDTTFPPKNKVDEDSGFKRVY